MATQERKEEGYSFSIAILIRDDTEDMERAATIVRYRELQSDAKIRSASESVLSFEELPGSHWVFKYDAATEAKQSAKSVNATCLKAAQLSHVAAYDAAVFLSGAYPRFKPGKKGSTAEDLSTTLVTIENATLIPSTSGSCDSSFRKAQYHTFVFSFPGIVSRAFRQMLEIRQCGLQRSGAMSLSKDLWAFKSFDRVEVVTGMCLLNEQALLSCINGGCIQPQHLAQQPISMSEMDTIIRLSTAIANTTALCIHQRSRIPATAFCINVDIPSVQYYKDAVESLKARLCTADQVSEWIAAIRNRRQRLFHAFREAVVHGLKHRGLSANDVRFELSSGLKAADEAIEAQMKQLGSGVEWLPEMMKSIKEDRSESWNEFLALQDDIDHCPNDWRQFSTLSYVYEVVKPVLGSLKTMQGSTCTPASAPISPVAKEIKQEGYFVARNSLSSTPVTRVLLLAVDDSDESRIYTKANNLLCKLGTTSARSPGTCSISPAPIVSRLLTICPAPQVIVGTSCAYKEWRRPSLWRAQLPNNEQFRTDQNVSEVHLDVLRRVYGLDLVDNLQRSLNASDEHLHRHSLARRHGEKSSM